MREGTLTGSNIPDQDGFEGDGFEGVPDTSWISRTAALPSDAVWCHTQNISLWGEREGLNLL